jgi:FkbM family methyltransferase
MKRKVRQFLPSVSRGFPYILIAIFKIKNWFPFILNLTGLRDSSETYFFRNGVKITTKEGIESSAIADIFVKKDYGEVAGDSIIVDIGANIGVYSIFAASTSKKAVVYAYEPMISSFDLLVQNIKDNNLEKRVFPFLLGIGAKKGKRKLYIREDSQSHSLYPGKKSKKYVEIDCVSLPDVFKKNKVEQCDILKVDCEGAEFEIFYNTPDEYLRKIKKIYLEYHNQTVNKDYNIKSLINFLEKKGFKIRKLRKNSKNSGIVWFERTKNSSGKSSDKVVVSRRESQGK